MARRAIVVFVALAAADTVLAAAGRGRARWLTKPLLMPVLMAGRDRPAQRALALGGVGDVALPGSGEAAFTAGLVSFLAGHVAWIIALRQRPGGGYLRARPVLAAPHLAAFGALNACLWKRTGKHRVPVIAYSTALLAMSGTALDSGSPRTAAGGALFLVSDALLALGKSGGLHLPAHEGLVMAACASAQALLARRQLAPARVTARARWPASTDGGLSQPPAARCSRVDLRRKCRPITLAVPGMNNPPGRYDVTVRVAGDDGHPPARRPSRPQPAGPHPAGPQASSAHTAGEII